MFVSLSVKFSSPFLAKLSNQTLPAEGMWILSGLTPGEREPFIPQPWISELFYLPSFLKSNFSLFLSILWATSFHPSNSLLASTCTPSTSHCQPIASLEVPKCPSALASLGWPLGDLKPFLLRVFTLFPWSIHLGLLGIFQNIPPPFSLVESIKSLLILPK